MHHTFCRCCKCQTAEQELFATAAPSPVAGAASHNHAAASARAFTPQTIPAAQASSGRWIRRGRSIVLLDT